MSTSSGEIISFYSYKGGTGRTMALANLAVLLAREGRRVQVLDFDLDAPGLHRYLRRSDDAGAVPGVHGVIDMYSELWNGLQQAFPFPGAWRSEDPHARAALRAVLRRVLTAPSLGEVIRIPETTRDPACTLRLVPAGSFDAHYPDRVRSLDWAQLHASYAEVFDEIRDAWRASYEVTLLDSRTGLTDVGSVSTVLLPDKLVVVLTPNEQSLHGAVEVARQAVQMARQAGRDLKIYPLLSRVEPGEELLAATWLRRVAGAFEGLYTAIGRERVGELLPYFEAMHVPHHSYFAYGEKLAVVEPVRQGIGSLVEAYQRFRETLAYSGPLDWLRAREPRPRPAEVRRALLVSFEEPFELPADLASGYDAIMHLPAERRSGRGQQLRAVPLDRSAWAQVREEIEDGLAGELEVLRQGMHLHVMAPYPAAALLGRRLDALLRAAPLHLYQIDPSDGTWWPFSAPGPWPTTEVYQPVQMLGQGRGESNAVFAIEGARPVADEPLLRLAASIDTRTVLRLRQRNSEPIRGLAEARGAVAAVRQTLETLQAELGASTIHLVTTAPVALIVEVGRLLSPSVLECAVVYQYDPGRRGYIPVLDVLHPERWLAG